MNFFIRDNSGAPDSKNLQRVKNRAILTYIKDASYNNIFKDSVWIKSLGAEFTTKDLDTVISKGNSILGSLEFIYDRGTMES